MLELYADTEIDLSCCQREIRFDIMVFDNIEHSLQKKSASDSNQSKTFLPGQSYPRFVFYQPQILQSNDHGLL